MFACNLVCGLLLNDLSTGFITHLFLFLFIIYLFYFLAHSPRSQEELPVPPCVIPQDFKDFLVSALCHFIDGYHL